MLADLVWLVPARCIRKVLREHILKCKAATAKPLCERAVALSGDWQTNQYHNRRRNKDCIYFRGQSQYVDSQVKRCGITVVHVVSSSKFAKKSEQAGVDAVVAEGFEAGGHNGVKRQPLYVWFRCARCSFHSCNCSWWYCERVCDVGNGSAWRGWRSGGDTLCGKRWIIGTREFQNQNRKPERRRYSTFHETIDARSINQECIFQQVDTAEKQGATAEELKTLLGRGRAKRNLWRWYDRRRIGNGSGKRQH